MSCSDVQTIKAGNGSQLTFSFDFPYIFKSEIHVYFWNATTKEYDEKLTTDSTYPWRITDANPTIVEFTSTAPPAPATPVDPGESAVDNVKIRRITKVDDIRALFNPGSAIRSDDLNKNFEQLRYAIQESNCQGIPDDVDQYLKDYYWDRYDNTLYDGDTWVSDDTKIATTAALDARFQDEVNDTFTKAELAAASNIMPNDDVAVPTTGALDDYIDEVITNDIGSSDGVSITDDGDGTITIGLTDSSVDFDKIKDSDQIQLADQVADPDVEGTDNNIFTARAATRRFNNYYQNDVPTPTDGVGIGQVWVDPNDDLTLSVWSGSAWVGITSGGTFTNQPKVVYVDASSGDDSNDGHRISRPKKTIAAALSDINGDSDGDGSIISVAPGIYAETLPLDIQKNDIGIIGQSLRTCIIHPKIPTADHAGYDVNTPHSQELQTMFRVNSGSYFANLTLTGLKASGSRGTGASLYTDTTYGLPPNQGWNFAFYPNATIKKSPYIQNVTNFSDSQINNVTFTPHTPGEGAAGDLDSAPTGGGILVDGSVPATASPLRSMVCDSYTHTALDGPGVFVTNNGYCQATSSYAFFNHGHITCLNGGQANLAASTTDFGRYGLIADGKSTSAIFTSNVDGAASSGAISFNINEPTAGSGWFGNTERPATNMLVEVNSVIYPILSATANTDSEGGNGWTVTISRPNPNNRSTNLGLNGAISDDAAVSFYLRSMIASSSHTMEYVGSGTDYRALPENGGVPVEANQKIELNNGKIWTATTDHNGKFTIGGNQTDDPFFEVDQQLGFVTIPQGSIAFNLVSDTTPQLGGNLDVNGQEIVTDADNENIVLNPHGTGQVNVSTSRIINVTDPSSDQDAATKAYVDTQVAGVTTPDRIAEGNTSVECVDTGTNGEILFDTEGITRMRINSSGNVGIGTPSPNNYSNYSTLTINGTTGGVLDLESNGTLTGELATLSNEFRINAVGTSSELTMYAGTSERMRIKSNGNVGIGTSSALSVLDVRQTNTGGATEIKLYNTDNTNALTQSAAISISPDSRASGARLVAIKENADFSTNGGRDVSLSFESVSNNTQTERMRIQSDGDLHLGSATNYAFIRPYESSTGNLIIGADQSATGSGGSATIFRNRGSNSMMIDSSGRLLVGLTSVGIGYTGKIVSRNDVNYSSTEFEDDATLVLQNESNNNSAVLVFHSNNSSGSSGRSAIVGGTVNNTKGKLGFYGDCSNLDSSTDADVVIDSSGNLGINTTSPSSKLHVYDGASGGTPSSNAKITLEDNGNAYLNLLVPSAYNCGVYFGDNNDADVGYINYSHGANSLAFGVNASERMRIDSSGRLLVGTSDSINNLLAGGVQIAGTSSDAYLTLTRYSTNAGSASGIILGRSKSGTKGTNTAVANDDILGAVSFSGTDGSNFRNAAQIVAHVDGAVSGGGAADMPGRLVFSTTPDGSASPQERMRIKSNGRVLVGTTSSDMVFNTSGGGCTLDDTGINVAATGQVVANFNRSTEDGTIVTFRSQGNNEGSVSISGSTTSFNGGHLSRWSQLADGAARTEILRGSVLSNLDEMCVWGEEDNEQLNRMKVSDVEGDVNVSGVFQCWDDDDETYVNDFFCAMTGDFVIRIAQGTTVARGDLLMSAGDGTAKPQDDDIIRSKTIAKVTSTVVSTTHADGSYCVPCVLMAC